MDPRRRRDASAVKPEAHEVTRRIVKVCGWDLQNLVGNEARLQGVDTADFVDANDP